MQDRYNPQNHPAPFSQFGDQGRPYNQNPPSNYAEPRQTYNDPRNPDRRPENLNERSNARSDYNQYPNSQGYQSVNYPTNSGNPAPYSSNNTFSGPPPTNQYPNPSQYSNQSSLISNQPVNYQNAKPNYNNPPEQYTGNNPQFSNQPPPTTFFPPPSYDQSNPPSLNRGGNPPGPQNYPPQTTYDSIPRDFRDKPNSNYSQDYYQASNYDPNYRPPATNSNLPYQQIPANIPSQVGFMNNLLPASGYSPHPASGYNPPPVSGYNPPPPSGYNPPIASGYPPYGKDLQNRSTGIREPLKEHLEKADSILDVHPYHRIIIDIGNVMTSQRLNVEALFKENDLDLKRVVHKRDFINTLGGKCALIRSNVLTAEELENIADIFDFFKQGYVYYIEFCKKIQYPDIRLSGPEVPQKNDLEWRGKTYKLIAEALVTKNLNPEEIFKKYDTKRDGQLKLADFKQAFQVIPTKLNPQEIFQIADEFDPRHEGIINYQRFLNTLEDFIHKKRSYEDIVNRLEKFCTDKSINLETKIKTVDPRDTKTLTKEDFLGVLHQIQFPLNPVESQTFCEEIAKSRDGFLDLRYLLQRLPRPRQLLDVSVIYDKIKVYIRTSRQTLTQIFAKFDKNGDGNLGPYEFSQALTQMGISDLSSTEITNIIQDLDKDKDGSISVSEFADKLGMQIDLVQTTVSYEFYRKIRKFLKNRNQTIQEFFLQYDYDRNNSLSKQELIKMLAMLNLTFDNIDIEKLYNELDANKDGRVTFMEFSLKYDKSIAAIEQKDGMNRTKLLRCFKGKNPKDLFKSSYNPDTNENIFTVVELRKGINLLGLNFTENDIDNIIENIVQDRKYAVLADLNNYFSIQAPVASTGPAQPKVHWAEK